MVDVIDTVVAFHTAVLLYPGSEVEAEAGYTLLHFVLVFFVQVPVHVESPVQL